MARDEFDSCAHASMDAFVSSSQTGGLVPSFAHGMAVPEAVSGAIYDTATNFFNSDQSAAECKAQLIASISSYRLLEGFVGYITVYVYITCVG